MKKITTLILTTLALIACNEKEVATQKAPTTSAVQAIAPIEKAQPTQSEDNNIAEVETLEKELETLLEEI